MRSVCPVCGTDVVSSADGSSWYHRHPRGGRWTPPFDAWSWEPVGHTARPTPDKIEHTCLTKDRHCPLCDPERANAWLRKLRAAEKKRAGSGQGLSTRKAGLDG